MSRDERGLARSLPLLENMDATLDAVAHACGLGNAVAFSRAIWVRYGAAPCQHRQSAKRVPQAVLRPPELSG